MNTVIKACLCGCGRPVKSKMVYYKYATPQCRNRIAQKNLRARKKLGGECP